MPLEDLLTSALVNAALGFGLLLALFVPLERCFTARSQPHLRADLEVDFGFFLFQYVVMSAVLLAVSGWLQRHVLPWSPPGLREAVQRLPAAGQAVLVCVLGDLGLYWGHRLSHTVPWLWRFHAVHHSAESLDWVAAHREHPLDGLYSHLFLTLPAVVLGVGREQIMAVYVFRGVCAVFVHSNVRMPLGPFGLLFGDPVLHRWHHARVAQTRHNFANLAPYLDVLFRTHHRPSDERYALGLEDLPGRSFALPLAHPGVSRLLSKLRARLARGLRSSPSWHAEKERP